MTLPSPSVSFLAVGNTTFRFNKNFCYPNGYLHITNPPDSSEPVYTPAESTSAWLTESNIDQVIAFFQSIKQSFEQKPS